MNSLMLGNEVEIQAYKEELTSTKLHLYCSTSIGFILTEDVHILISIKHDGQNNCKIFHSLPDITRNKDIITSLRLNNTCCKTCTSIQVS